MKPLYKKTKTAAGTEITYASGRKILVPAGITIFAPKAGFEAQVLETVERAFDRAEVFPDGIAIHTGKKNGWIYKILALNVGKRVYWRVHGVDGPVAWGYLEVRDQPGKSPYLTAALAACLPAHRGQGLYPAVLKAIRKQYSIVVMSDQILSPTALLLWATIGSYVDAQRRYRLNPARRAHKRKKLAPNAWRGAQQIAFAESVMGDKIA